MSCSLNVGYMGGDRWTFGIDRGGTFTDVVAVSPDGTLVTEKLLSEDPGRYEDAAIFAIRSILGLGADEPVPTDRVASISMGTTVGTNALLERTGARVCLVASRGFGDALAIGYQARPDIFALDIHKPRPLYEGVVELDGRMAADGTELVPMDPEQVERELRGVLDRGVRSLAVVLLNSYRDDAHERTVGQIALRLGFEQVSLSSPTMRVQKMVGRGDTTVVDAYLNPVLSRYVERVRRDTGDVPLRFMRSSGGLVDAGSFTGKDAIISGPAGGVIAASQVAASLGIERVIGFDMGGTSTDVSRYEGGRCEKVYETETAGIRIHAPMVNVVTVAAGGGSVLHFDGTRLTVGPDSAGADPGPACYRNGGPLTVTDANLMLGRILPHRFPRVFGPGHDLSLDLDVVRKLFAERSEEVHRATGRRMTPEEVAEGYLRIANENMVHPIRSISVAKGFDPRDHTLMCFGGAGAQHACAIARELEMTRIVLHPLAGVLSAYGMLLADVLHEDAQAVLLPLEDASVPAIDKTFTDMERVLAERVAADGIGPGRTTRRRFADVRPRGADTSETVPYDGIDACRVTFCAAYRRHYGFEPPTDRLEVVTLRVEAVGERPKPAEPEHEVVSRELGPDDALEVARSCFRGTWHDTPVYRRDDLHPGDSLRGPAIVVENTSTIIVEPDFAASVDAWEHIELHQVAHPPREEEGTACDPVLLEVFSNLFASAAEQMGSALQRTAHSVNIKERLDFSCAVFDAEGGMVASAHHIPVHLGAMGASVRNVLATVGTTMRQGDVYVTNDPFHGGSHLPDVTVVTPVFAEDGRLLFLAASRGHHADIGGTTPGSMPPDATILEQEGVVIECYPLVAEGRFDETGITQLLSSGPYPARNLRERLSDLRAQVAANATGVRELQRLVADHGLGTVQAYMGHVLDHAEAVMRRAIVRLPDGAHTATDQLDDGTVLKVTVTVDGDEATVDFDGTGPQHPGNLNAPSAVAMAAVLYVFRTLVEEDVPLNEGCLRPLSVRIPEACVLNPKPGAAVAGGNVETSQRVVDVLYRALGTVAASQGTMNNLTFGPEDGGYGYYETIAGGAGAGPGFNGASAVHTHMTNTRITDPEVLEQRYPEVRVEAFAVRSGSGGEGLYHGGDGVERRLRFLAPCRVSILSERRQIAPYGLEGGGDGATGENVLIRANGTEEQLSGRASVSVSPGDQLVVRTPGGGGWGEMI